MVDILFPLIAGIVFVIAFTAMIIYIVMQNKSVIERARKIDPSVKTITDAEYVLQKDIAQSFGKGDNETKN